MAWHVDTCQCLRDNIFSKTGEFTYSGTHDMGVTTRPEQIGKSIDGEQRADVEATASKVFIYYFIFSPTAKVRQSAVRYFSTVLVVPK